MKRLIVVWALYQVVAATAAPRPAAWAVPVEVEGVPNFHRIAPGVYRSAQPTREGLRELERLGFRTVISLRNRHDEAPGAAGTSLRVVSLGMPAWRLSGDRLTRVLAVLRDPAQAPVLVHCQHGADRTGALCALYRMTEQGWTREEAIGELRRGGYGYHAVWLNIPRYLRRVNIVALRERVEHLTAGRILTPKPSEHRSRSSYAP